MGTTPPARPAKPAAPAVTLTQVLEDYPLFRTWKGEWSTPGTISRDCKQCGKETTWKYNGNLASSPSGSFKLPYYRCVNCENDNVYFLIVVMNNGRLMKAGQFPMPSVRVPNSKSDLARQRTSTEKRSPAETRDTVWGQSHTSVEWSRTRPTN